VETILGEGGYVLPPAGFLNDIQAICRRHGILFIADEVQCGYGRTGKMFAGMLCLFVHEKHNRKL